MRADNQAEYNTYGLHVGTVKTPYSKEFLEANPYLAAYSDPKLIPQPTIVVGFDQDSEQIRRTMVDHIADILFKNKPAATALNEAQKAIMAFAKK